MHNPVAEAADLAAETVPLPWPGNLFDTECKIGDHGFSVPR